MDDVPDWKGAPDWATYRAKDADGAWWWYEEKPVYEHNAGRWVVDGGRSVPANPAAMTLEQRP